ncbi:MAG: carboxypeptidase regulatory-like domain-containing protein, partial [Planctomycetota bacterium]
MQSDSRSILLYGVLAATVVVALLCVFVFDLFEDTKEPSDSGEFVKSTSGMKAPVPDAAQAPGDTEESADTPRRTLVANYETEEEPADEARQPVKVKGESSYCILGRVAMKDGSPLPEDLKITGLYRDVPFSRRSTFSDRTERYITSSYQMPSGRTVKSSTLRTGSLIPSVKPDQGGIFLLKGIELDDPPLLPYPVHPYLRVADPERIKPRLLEEAAGEEAEPFTTLLLELGGVVEGQVFEPDGETPVSAVSVSLDGTFNPFTFLSANTELISGHKVTTDDKGFFRFEQVPAGPTLRLKAKKEGFASSESKEVSAKAGEAIAFKVSLRKAGSISGTVKDAKGLPVKDIDVDLMLSKANFANITDTEAGDTETDESGVFRFDDLAPDKYSVMIAEPGYVSQAIKGIKLESGEHRDDLKFVLDQGLGISGTVMALIKLTLTQSLANFSDSITEQYRPHFSRTEAEGTFTVMGLKDKTYDLDVTADGYSAHKQGDIAAGTGGLLITLHEGGVISGIVFAEASGEPVKEYKIRITQTKGGETSMFDPFGFQNQSSRSINDDKGKFTLNGLVPGTYSLEFKADGFSNKKLKGVTLEPESEARGLIVAMIPESSIIGTVRDARTGEPIAGATISRTSGLQGMMQSLMTGESFSTNSEGRFKVGGLSEGKIRLVARHNDYEETSTDELFLAQSETLEGIEILMNQGGTIKGHIKTADGQPVPGSSFMVSNTTATVLKSVAADSEGYYEVRGLAKGTYTVTKMPSSISLDGEDFLGTFMGEMQVQTVKLDVDEVKEVDFIMGEKAEEGAKLTGVVRQDGKPVPGVFLQLHKHDADDGSDEDAMLKTASTDKEGRYVISELQPGTYTMLLTKTSVTAPGT